MSNFFDFKLEFPEDLKFPDMKFKFKEKQNQDTKLLLEIYESPSIEIKPLDPPTGIIYYFDFTYGNKNNNT